METTLSVIEGQKTKVKMLQARIYDLRQALLYASDLIEEEGLDLSEEDERMLNEASYNDRTDTISRP